MVGVVTLAGGRRPHREFSPALHVATARPATNDVDLRKQRENQTHRDDCGESLYDRLARARSGVNPLIVPERNGAVRLPTPTARTPAALSPR